MFFGGKRTLEQEASSHKRRAPDPYEKERIADLPEALACFSDQRAAGRAKASGLLRNWSATDKWKEAEPLVLKAHADLPEGDELEEEDLLEAVPMLDDFEPETFEAILAQSRRHARYERAARTLLDRQAERLEAAHARELRQLRMEFEAEATRTKASADMRVGQAEKRASEGQRTMAQAATEQEEALEEKIAQLEAELESVEAAAAPQGHEWRWW